jgi:transcriptional regulator with XRE-family HTH domain
MEIITKTIIDVQNTLREDKIYHINLGIFLRRVRMDRKKTQTQVAKSLGVTFQQVQKYEKGTNAISLYNLVKWWDYLKVNRDLHTVLKNCSNNFYLRQIFRMSDNEDQLEAVKNEVLNKRIDLKRFDAFIDI